MADTYGWKAHLVDDFMHGRKRLIVYRNTSTDTDVLNGDGSMTRHDIGAAPIDPPGFVLPHGAWEAIEELVLPKAKEGEIARLLEALDLERRRVDSVLDAYLPKREG